jgi:PAS domain S-box-containing protein
MDTKENYPLHSDMDIPKVIEVESEQPRELLSIVYDAMESALSGIIITDMEGIIRYVNSTFLKIFDYKDKSEILGSDASMLFYSDEVTRFADVKLIIDSTTGVTQEFTAVKKDGYTFIAEVSSSIVTSSDGKIIGRMASFVDISKRKQLAEQQENLVKKLQSALDKIETLKGLIPICANCKSIRDDKGFWHAVEKYIEDHSNVAFSHSICPDCVKKLYPKFYNKISSGKKVPIEKVKHNVQKANEEKSD